MDDVTKKWADSSKDGRGYRHSLKSDGFLKLKTFLRVWRKLLRVLKVGDLKKISVLEAGCGGGKHLASFALHGSRVIGVDVSPEVILNATSYFKEIEEYTGKRLNYEFDAANFFEYTRNEKFDIVFHNGVAEHFLDSATRLSFLSKMFAFVRPGGYLVSIVPSGIHPLREEMKKSKLGGYNIPEIDYSPEIMAHELVDLGGVGIKVLPHNIFGYLLIKPMSQFKKLLYLLFQIIPAKLLPTQFAFRHSSTLVAICRKQ